MYKLFILIQLFDIHIYGIGGIWKKYFKYYI